MSNKKTIKNQKSKIKNNKQLLNIIADEINVKKIVFDPKIKNNLELDIQITPELKAEGRIRELIRMIQDLRKDAKYTPKDKVEIFIETDGHIKTLIKNREEQLKAEIGSKKIEFKRTEKFDAESDTQIDGIKIWIGIKKI